MYHPTGRVLTVLELLQSRVSMTGMELADRLECDIRTVRRYIGKLQDIGIPVESEPGPGGGYRLRPGFRLPPLILSEDEAVAVLLGLLGTQWLRVSLPGTAIESTLSKISRVLPTTTRERVKSIAGLLIMPLDTAGVSLDVDLLLRLSQAVGERRCVNLEYQSREASSRIIEPYGVAAYDGHWYVVGFCRLRQDIRVFRLDRIRNAALNDSFFERPASFDLAKYIYDAIESQPWRIRLRFRASVDSVRQAFGSLGRLDPTAEGCDYDGSSSDLDQLARRLLVSRLPFEILEPHELRDAFGVIAEEAKGLAVR